jgi:hypothetical protein
MDSPKLVSIGRILKSATTSGELAPYVDPPTASATHVSVLQAEHSKMRYAGLSPKRGRKVSNSVTVPQLVQFCSSGLGENPSSAGMAPSHMPFPQSKEATHSGGLATDLFAYQ